MQRTYSVLIFGLMLLVQGPATGESRYEQDGTVYKFRQEDTGSKQQSPAQESAAAGLSRPELKSEAELLRELEQKGFVFRPMRKRKTLDDPPEREEMGNSNPDGYTYRNCPTPEAAQQQFQQLPRANPLNPVVPPAPAMVPPPLGYPYTYPSPNNFPYPSGGFSPFPGGFGYPRW